LWESLRKYLVKVGELLRGGKVYLGNNLIHILSPKKLEEAGGVFPPPPEKLLEEAMLK